MLVSVQVNASWRRSGDKCSHVVLDRFVNHSIIAQAFGSVDELLASVDECSSPLVVSNLGHALVRIRSFEKLKDGSKVVLFCIGVDWPCFAL